MPGSPELIHFSQGLFMNTTNAMTSSTHGQPMAEFRQNALDLNPGIVEDCDGQQIRELQTTQQAQANAHWLLHSTDYATTLQDLVATVRQIQRYAGLSDGRSDQVLTADLLKEMGLWDHPQPTGQWGNARFMIKFLVAFSRLYLRAKTHEGIQHRIFDEQAKLTSS